jgi:hypothetical protein
LGFDRRPPPRDDNNTGRSSDRPPVSKRTSADASVLQAMKLPRTPDSWTARLLIDDAFDAYLEWRDESAEVWHAYKRWNGAQAREARRKLREPHTVAQVNLKLSRELVRATLDAGAYRVLIGPDIHIPTPPRVMRWPHHDDHLHAMF